MCAASTDAFAFVCACLGVETATCCACVARTSEGVVVTKGVVVDLAIAIVVNAVAFFGLGLDGLFALYATAQTLGDSFLAGAAFDTRHVAVFADIREFVIDLTVAIVVFSVACFERRDDFTFAFTKPLAVFAACFESVFADATVTEAGKCGKTSTCFVGVASAIDPVVDLAVAIVVLFVADLGAWKAFAKAGAPDLLGATSLFALFADARGFASSGSCKAIADLAFAAGRHTNLGGDFFFRGFFDTFFVEGFLTIDFFCAGTATKTFDTQESGGTFACELATPSACFGGGGDKASRQQSHREEYRHKSPIRRTFDDVSVWVWLDQKAPPAEENSVCPGPLLLEGAVGAGARPMVIARTIPVAATTPPAM